MLAAFVGALALHLTALRRLEASFQAMDLREEEIRLAMEFGDAVRSQYGYQMRLVRGEVVDLVEYEGQRSRVLEAGRRLRDRLDAPESIAQLDEIRLAAARVDDIFRDQVAPVLRGKDVPTRVAPQENYQLVALIEDGVNRLVTRLQKVTSSSRREMVEVERRSVRWAAMLLLATPLLVLAAVIYLSRSVAKPLARLSEGASALAHGDLDAHIDVATPDEFGQLASEFNAMTVALKQHQVRLVESEKLAGIGRVAAGLAHELNNPLQVMLGYLSLNRDLSDRRLAEQLAAVEDEVRRCQRIVESLLDLARPAAAGPAPVDLRGLCEDVSESVRVCMKPAAPRLSVDGAGMALADQEQIRQVVFNVMKNAVEAAGPGGGVDVEIGGSNGMVEVAIRDSGPGIAPEARARLFEPFFTTKPTGTGLGLAVSRAIALAYGGDIEVRNGESGGAVFTLRLPRPPEARS